MSTASLPENRCLGTLAANCQGAAGVERAMVNASPNTVVLGCTHFPYLREALRKRTALPVIDPSERLAELVLTV